MTVGVPDRVADAMERDPPIAHYHESLARARSRVRASGARTLAVVDGDRIAAVLSAAALERRCASVGDCDAVHLRDQCRPPVPFCYVEDDLAAARSALTIAAAAEGTACGAVAVVDDERRLVGVVEAEALGDAPPGGPPRRPEDPTDQRHLENPKLTVYAPWAALDG